MNIAARHPLLLLVIGSLIGAGVVQTWWVVSTSGKVAVSHSNENTPSRSFQARSSSATTTGKNLHGKERFEENGRLFAGKDPQKAWRQSLAMENFSERLAFTSGLMREWALKDPEAALAMAGTLPAGHLKQEAFDAACAGWASQHPEAASAWATDHLTGPLAAESFGMIAKEWAGNNPAAAAAWVSSLPTSVLSEGATTAVIDAWVEQDPNAAATWINTFTDPDRKTEAMSTLASEWCAQSPADASKWVDSQLGKPGGGEVAEALIGAWGAQDPYAASQWVMTLPENLQTASAGTLLSLWATCDPKVAADWAAQFPTGETRSQAIPEIASTWAGSEPEKAVAWTLALPDSPEQQVALDDAVRTWTLVAPATLGTWVDQQPSNDATDHLRTLGASVLIESHPLDAMAMASKISDPVKMQASEIRLLKRWGKSDPAAAGAWAAQAGLPPAVIGRPRINP